MPRRRDYSFFFHFLHGFGNETTDCLVVVGRHAGNVLDFLEIIAYFLAHVLDLCHHGSHGLVDTALEIHGIGTGGNILETYGDYALGKHGGGSGAVAGIVAGFRSHFLHELGAHVAERLVEFNFPCHSYTVLGDMRCAELLGDDYIATLGAKCYLDGIGESVDTFFELFASFYIEFDIFSHCCWFCLVILRLQRELRSGA